MNNKWLILINPLLVVLILIQFITGLNYFFHFIDRKVFLTLHMYGGYILSVLIGLHLFFNWFWVNNIFLKSTKKGKPVKK